VQYGEADHILASILLAALEKKMGATLSGREVLERLVRENKYLCLEVLVNRGLIPIGKDAPSIRYYDDALLLVVAIIGKAYQCLEFLLRKGVDTNTGSPLQCACEKSDLKSVQLLIQYGAIVNPENTAAAEDKYAEW
jgi:hypothetical protein